MKSGIKDLEIMEKFCTPVPTQQELRQRNHEFMANNNTGEFFNQQNNA